MMEARPIHGMRRLDADVPLDTIHRCGKIAAPVDIRLAKLHTTNLCGTWLPADPNLTL